MTSPFIVFAMPRTRSFWLSRFLSYGPWTCEHDISVRLRGLDDIQSMLGTPFLGTVETAAASWWRLFHGLRPDLRVVVLRRPVDEAFRSMIAAGGEEFNLPAVRAMLEHMDRKLTQIEHRVPGVISLTMGDLGSVEACRRVFEHCLQIPFDPEWHQLTAPVNLQVSLQAQLRYCRANAAQITRLVNTVTAWSRADLAKKAKRIDSDSMTYQEEPFDQFLRDGRGLIADHHVSVGKPVDEVNRMNLGLMGRLAEAGVLRVITARSNGRLFGYLVTITCPALDHLGQSETHTTAWFADPSAPGVGTKLYRKAIALARARGVNTVFSRTGGVGGLAPRNAAVFKRQGARHFGDLYALELN